MQSRLGDIRSLGAEVVAVSVDSVEENRKVIEKLGLDFDILSDSQRSMINDWGVTHPGGGMNGDIARPASFVVGPDGFIRWRNLTENWRVRVRPTSLVEALKEID